MDEALKLKITQLQDALKDFKQSLEIDQSEIDNDVILDTLRSGQIQKFEMTLEILWKTLKKYLWKINGIDAQSPKTTIKAWAENKYCNYEEYEQLVGFINKRSKLSHIYNKNEYLKIHGELDQAYKLMAAQACRLK